VRPVTAEAYLAIGPRSMFQLAKLRSRATARASPSATPPIHLMDTGTRLSIAAKVIAKFRVTSLKVWRSDVVPGSGLARGVAQLAAFDAI
jgi:hypothetical protein